MGGVRLRVYVVPSDQTGPGYHRLLWPAEMLRRQGHDVREVPPSSRNWLTYKCPDNHLHVSGHPKDADVIVLARVTHARVVELIEPLRREGIAVVVDLDDDLTSLHPANAAFRAMHPKGVRASAPPPKERLQGRRSEIAHLLSTEDNGYHQAWGNLAAACKAATMVTVSTPALLPIYAPRGNGRLVPNYLASHYYGLPHEDSEVVGWPGAMWSHPNDPQVTRPAIPRLVAEGVKFLVVGSSEGAGEAFGLPGDPPMVGPVPLQEWPKAIAEHIGVGIVPLAATKFNASKSWLKGIELAAAGVPFVASPVPEYRRLHRMGAGLLAAKPKDWLRKVRQLVQSPSMRQELSEAGREVAAGLRLEDHAEEHWAAWSDALELQRGKAPAASVV